jgi:hypothetical protein
MFFHETKETLYFIRYVLENAENFEQAIKLARETQLMANAYYTIGGLSTNEGCVIERSEFEVHAEYCLDDKTWFLVQTNYDRDKPDNPHDYRRVPAEKYLESVGEDKFSKDDIMHILTNPPNHVIHGGKTGDEGTITTVLSWNASPASFSMWVWDWSTFDEEAWRRWKESQKEKEVKEELSFLKEE